MKAAECANVSFPDPMGARGFLLTFTLHTLTFAPYFLAISQ
jgi:hypothetical protein